MANRQKIVGDAAIGRAIRSLKGVLEGAGSPNNRVQEIAVAIVEHAAGDGNGDVSRALQLVQTVNRSRTMNTAFLIGWFRYFASTNINLRGNDGAGTVKLMAKDAKGYRGFDVDGARVNKWFDAFDEDGNRAPWYAGPAPAEFQPLTVGDLAKDLIRFADREMKKLDDTKTVGKKVVPLVQLADNDRVQFINALDVIRRLANSIARHEEILVTRKKAEELAANVDEPIVELIQPKEQAVG